MKTTPTEAIGTPAPELLQAERSDLVEQIEVKRAAARRHTFWAVLGVSPGALIPLALSIGQIGVGALLGGVVLMTAFEVRRAARAAREADELERELAQLIGGSGRHAGDQPQDGE